MIYDSNGVALRADQIADAVKNWPQLYSDDGQTTPATRANLLSELDDARTTSAATVQALIDADEKLSALAEPPVASADAVDHEWVVVTFPTDATAPKFWSGVAGEIVAYHMPFDRVCRSGEVILTRSRLSCSDALRDWVHCIAVDYRAMCHRSCNAENARPTN